MAAGLSLLESVVALAVAGVTAAAGVGSAAALADAFRVDAARRVVIDAMLEARRLAYAQESPMSVRAAVGESSVEIVPPRRRIDLPACVTIAKAPADSSVDFHASGAGDNATVQLTCGAASATVVVNQRGMVR